jgi:hypothetical protein
MSKSQAPEVTGLIRQLTVDDGLPIREFRLTRDEDKQPVSARLMFGAAVSDIPKNLPTHILSDNKEIPISYQTFEKR